MDISVDFQGCECCVAEKTGTRFGGILIIPQCGVNGETKKKPCGKRPGLAN